MADEDYTFDNLECIDWIKIREKYPMAFDNYMAFPDLESFMVAFNCTIKVNDYLNTEPEYIYYETRVECKERAIMIIGLHTFGEVKTESIRLLFELVEKQMENNGFTRN